MQTNPIKLEKVETDKIAAILGAFSAKTKKVNFCFSGRMGGQSKGNYTSLNLSFRQDDDSSTVKKNWQKLLSVLSLPSFVLSPEQVHGNDICFVDVFNLSLRPKSDKFSLTVFSSVDGLFISQQSVPIGALFADCIPVVIFDLDIRFAGVLHAGWRGTLENISYQAVKSVVSAKNLEPSNLFAVIGPGIGRCCYKVSKELLIKFKNYPEALQLAPASKIDLKRVNRMQLLQAGLSRERIVDVDICTSCNTDYFSYRRDKGKTGRQAAIVWIEEHKSQRTEGVRT